MIRVNVYDSRGKLNVYTDSSLNEISIGRALSNTIVVPDFQLEPTEIQVRKNENGVVQIAHGRKVYNLLGLQALKVGRYSVVITDLRYYSENNSPTVESRTSYLAIGLLSIITAILVFFDGYYLETEPKVAILALGFVMTPVVMLLINSIFSAVSWFANGELRFLKMLPYSIGIILLGLVAYLDWFDLRWYLPEIFQNNLAWVILILIPIFFLFKKIVHISMEGLSTAAQRMTAYFPVLTLIIFAALRYLPIQNTYSYAGVSLRPPLHEFMETKPVEMDQGLEQIKNFLQDQ